MKKLILLLLTASALWGQANFGGTLAGPDVDTIRAGAGGAGSGVTECLDDASDNNPYHCTPTTLPASCTADSIKTLRFIPLHANTDESTLAIDYIGGTCPAIPIYNNTDGTETLTNQFSVGLPYFLGLCLDCNSAAGAYRVNFAATPPSAAFATMSDDPRLNAALAAYLDAKQDPIAASGAAAMNGVTVEVPANVVSGVIQMDANGDAVALRDFRATRNACIGDCSGSYYDISTQVWEPEVFSASQTVTTGDQQACLVIPNSVLWANSLLLKAVEIRAGPTAGTGMTVQLSRKRLTNPTTQASVDMLSTRVTTDSGEFWSGDATTPAVINTSNDDILPGDRVCVDVDTAGGAEGLNVVVRFAP